VQEAQQDTLLNFERYMDECLQRGWQGDKSRLFGIIAPHTGLGAAAGDSAGPGQGLVLGNISNLPPAGTSRRVADCISDLAHFEKCCIKWDGLFLLSMKWCSCVSGARHGG
jgi:hypothetical protein